MLLTSIVADGRLPIPSTSHLAGAIGRAPEIVTIIAVERDLIAQIVVGGPGPVLAILKVLWSWAANCFGGEGQVQVTEREVPDFRVSLLVSGSLSLRNSAFLVPQQQCLPFSPWRVPQPMESPTVPPSPFLDVLLTDRAAWYWLNSKD